jgi:lichenan operon transcriptional antiterminator
MILRDPVNWDDKQVQLIMMLCFNRNERYIFNEVFEPLSMILSDSDKLKTALTCRTSEEFIGTIANFLE